MNSAVSPVAIVSGLSLFYAAEETFFLCEILNSEFGKILEKPLPMHASYASNFALFRITTQIIGRDFVAKVFLKPSKLLNFNLIEIFGGLDLNKNELPPFRKDEIDF